MNMHELAFAALAEGTPLGPHVVTVSGGANERYWRSAGVDHPALAGGALYPMIAANLTVLCFAATCPEPVIQTRQRVRAHRRVVAGAELITAGRVVARYEKRGRVYVDIEATVATSAEPGVPVWTSEVSFTPVATVGLA